MLLVNCCILSPELLPLDNQMKLIRHQQSRVLHTHWAPRSRLTFVPCVGRAAAHRLLLCMAAPSGRDGLLQVFVQCDRIECGASSFLPFFGYGSCTLMAVKRSKPISGLPMPRTVTSRIVTWFRSLSADEISLVTSP